MNAPTARRVPAEAAGAGVHDPPRTTTAPLRTALAGVVSLTDGDRRVDELATSGSTNRTIAPALFVSDTPAETHLSHAFDKLGGRSRRMPAEALTTVTPSALRSWPSPAIGARRCLLVYCRAS
jgi:DNA-binding NarL/FixJ family response regulator